MHKAWLILALAFLVSGCDVFRPIVTEIAVGPGAAEKWPEIVRAVDELNAAIGEDVFTVGPATGNGLVKGAARVKIVGKISGRENTAGRCSWRFGSVTILLEPNAQWQTIAHEIGHAAGLDHYTGGEPNIMNANAVPSVAVLDAEQIEYLSGLVD
jgi:hypothetical protein